MCEIWKSINKYDGIYEVSNMGNVRSLDRCILRSDAKSVNYKGKELKSNTDKNGYKLVNLSFLNQVKTFKVHRLVASAFIENCKSKPIVNHKNGIKCDNRVENLEWVTCGENVRHAINTGLVSYSGKRSRLAKLSDNQVRYIRKSKKQQKELAKEFDIDPKAIRQILNYKTYKEYL